jgi:hypothetical protein
LSLELKNTFIERVNSGSVVVQEQMLMRITALPAQLAAPTQHSQTVELVEHSLYRLDIFTDIN